MEKKYWKSLEELNHQPANKPEAEFGENKSLLELMDEELAQKPSSRRNFLKFCGFGFATAAIATSCENPVKKAIPYLNKPEEITPGMANHYASTYFDGSEYNPILVKVRDGRPIKIEGNELTSITRGGASARVQASILSLYDGDARLKGPSKQGKAISWANLDNEVTAKLKELSASEKSTVLLTANIISPSTRKLINDFTNFFPGSKHVVYDPVSFSGMLTANRDSFGDAVIPQYRFDKAAMVVAFSADFLGTWLAPSEFAAAYATQRDLTNGEKSLSYHVQIESGLSISGSKADLRIPVKPSEEGKLLLGLYNEIASLSGNGGANSASSAEIKEIASRLWENRGKSLVVSGSNDYNQQMVINAINSLLGNVGSTIDFSSAFLTRQAIDGDMEQLIKDMQSGQVASLILWNVNPVYDYYNADAFTEALKNLPLSVSFNSALDETGAHVIYSAPAHHYLEAWGDFEYKRGFYSLSQPAIRNIYNTRQPQENLLKWVENTEDYYTYLKNFWQSEILNGSEDEWRTAVQKGLFEKTSEAQNQPFNDQQLSAALSALGSASASNGWEMAMYQNLSLGNGQHANNPWLMEMPDPVSKICWDNFAAISADSAAKLGVTTGSLININNIELPVLVQPGQADETISVALGYGHTQFGKVANNVGKNVFSLVQFRENARHLYLTGIQPTVVAGTYPLASTQMHHSMEGRPIVRDTILGQYLESQDAGNEMHKEFEDKHVTLYKEVEFNGHHWGMAVDLNKCTGCSSCVIACQAENNVPVVGKEEVMKYRIMHWMRIDRYYAGDTKNPEVVFQPLMCQHCDNAPCENVCPVSATNHSSEGLNQMAYNRCVGTKYCMNNCPYKVRRFNWFRYATNENFDYNMNSEIGRMVLNPDVNVRERGVVEKCSLCVQRIQEKKLLAKLENRKLEDGEIQPACAQTCPSGAIIFGDVNDPESRISKLFKDPRNYNLLEELHTLPSVGYLTLVRNKPGSEA